MPKGVFKRTKKYREIMTAAMNGKTPWNKGLTKHTDKRVLEYTKKSGLTQRGKKLSEAHREKIRKAHLGLKKVKGEGHAFWKGTFASYRAQHSWVRYWKGNPKLCESCGARGNGHKMHWANVSGLYKRDLDDYVRLCATCHSHFDITFHGTKHGKKKKKTS